MAAWGAEQVGVETPDGRHQLFLEPLYPGTGLEHQFVGLLDLDIRDGPVGHQVLFHDY